jgi:hypothetical protein
MICPKCNMIYFSVVAHQYDCPKNPDRKLDKYDYDVLRLTSEDRKFLREMLIKVD